MKITRANVSDLSDILSIYAQAREYMKEQNNPEQWKDNYPSEELVRTDIEEEKCYIAAENDEICGVFYFAVERDKAYDIIENGSWRNDRPYAVVHRIAVGKQAHNKGVAGKCIAFAVNQCKRQNIYDLRMDTHKDNVPMQRFLEKQDFVKCGTVLMDDGSERIAYHKIIIRNVVFDVGQVLLEFDWRSFISNMDISEDKKIKLQNVTLGNMSHWNEHDRGMDDEEFIQKSLMIEPEIGEELEYYMKNIGTIVKEYSYSVPLIKELKKRGYMVYILSNYGKTPIKYAYEHMKFFKEVHGMIISSEVGCIKPEPEIYEILFDKFGLVPGECVFIDDRADNIEAAKDMGMSGIVFENIAQVINQLRVILCEDIFYCNL